MERDVRFLVNRAVSLVTMVVLIEIEGLECVVGHVTRNNHGDSKW